MAINFDKLENDITYLKEAQEHLVNEELVKALDNVITAAERMLEITSIIVLKKKSKA